MHERALAEHGWTLEGRFHFGTAVSQLRGLFLTAEWERGSQEVGLFERISKYAKGGALGASSGTTATSAAPKPAPTPPASQPIVSSGKLKS